MLAHAATILQQKCKLDRQKPVVIGVSGGPDSLCLLDFLARQRYRVIAAHLNHLLRPNAAEDAQSVLLVAKRLNVPFVLKEEDIREFASANNLSIEEAARITRYRYLFEVAHSAGAQAVAVAHNADDQVETFLMHLLRGAGLGGLRGMDYCSLPNAWSDTVALVRPLLGTWREEINAYLEHRGLTPVFDITNLDVIYHRNRIRHGLIPYLEAYNPEITKTLHRTAGLLADDYELIDALVEAAYDRCLRDAGSRYIAFDRNSLLREPLAVRRYLLRRAVRRVRGGLRDIDYETIERAASIVETPTRSGQADLAGGLRLVVEEETVWVAEWDAPLPCGTYPQAPEMPVELPLPREGFATEVRLPGGWVLRVEETAADAGVLAEIAANPDPYRTWIDPAKVTLPLTVRRRKPGDRFKPLGMGGSSTKLSDLMINARLPKRARAAYPLVCGGEEVLWVPGLRAGEVGRVEMGAVSKIYRLELLPDAGSGSG